MTVTTANLTPADRDNKGRKTSTYFQEWTSQFQIELSYKIDRGRMQKHDFVLGRFRVKNIIRP